MRLSTPLDETTVRGLKVGDVVHIDGIVLTGRDEMHHRALALLRERRSLPVDLDGAVLYHCGPIVAPEGDGYRLVAAGPTTSARMDGMEPELIARAGIRAIIGKGGMSGDTLDAMIEQGCVYLAATGGAAVSLARGIVAVEDVHWLDLGMPEALWVLRAENLGPLVVTMDTHGRRLHRAVASWSQATLAKLD